MASRSRTSVPTPQPEGAEIWRRGVSRLIEQGRFMWMLGEGFNAALTAHHQGWRPSDEESLVTEVFGWMQQAFPAGSRVEPIKQAKSRPSPPLARRKTCPPAPVGLALMERSLSGAVYPVVWVGSQEIAGRWASMALAVGIDGLRRVLALTTGSVREQGVAQELAGDLARRGLPSEGLLFITEGSRTLDRALTQAWIDGVRIAHCRTSLRNDILAHFPEASRIRWATELDAAWSLPVDEAAAVLQHLESLWASECPGAAERLGRSREASLLVAGLDVSSPLKERLESLGTLRMAFKQALRWAPPGPAVAALAVGVPAWLQRSRRLVGWQKLELLAHRLRGLSVEPKNNAAPQV